MWLHILEWNISVTEILLAFSITSNLLVYFYKFRIKKPIFKRSALLVIPVFCSQTEREAQSRNMIYFIGLCGNLIHYNHWRLWEASVQYPGTPVTWSRSQWLSMFSLWQKPEVLEETHKSTASSGDKPVFFIIPAGGQVIMLYGNLQENGSQFPYVLTSTYSKGSAK